MTHSVKSHIGKVLLTAVTLVGAVSVGQAATAGEYWVPANAPITYKMANPADMMGHVPAPAPQYASRPQMAPTAQNLFDQSRVDQTLYSHQRVGKPYTVAGKRYKPKHQPRYDMVGTASWYGDKFHGKLTASGEKYDKNAMTAAHKTLPLNSMVVVTNLKTGVSNLMGNSQKGSRVKGVFFPTNK